MFDTYTKKNMIFGNFTLLIRIRYGCPTEYATKNSMVAVLQNMLGERHAMESMHTVSWEQPLL